MTTNRNLFTLPCPAGGAPLLVVEEKSVLAVTAGSLCLNFLMEGGRVQTACYTGLPTLDELAWQLPHLNRVGDALLELDRVMAIHQRNSWVDVYLRDGGRSPLMISGEGMFDFLATPMRALDNDKRLLKLPHALVLAAYVHGLAATRNRPHFAATVLHLYGGGELTLADVSFSHPDVTAARNTFTAFLAEMGYRLLDTEVCTFIHNIVEGCHGSTLLLLGGRSVQLGITPAALAAEVTRLFQPA